MNYQAVVASWMRACFGEATLYDVEERCRRFMEEAGELVQSCGMSREQAHQMIDFAFDRGRGEVRQEVGGVLVCLAALSEAFAFDMQAAGDDEIASAIQSIEKIRAKHALKPDNMKSAGAAERNP